MLSDAKGTDDIIVATERSTRNSSIVDTIQNSLRDKNSRIKFILRSVQENPTYWSSTMIHPVEFDKVGVFFPSNLLMLVYYTI